VTDPTYRPRRGAEGDAGKRPPLSQRARDMMKSPAEPGSTAAPDLPAPGYVPPSTAAPGGEPAELQDTVGSPRREDDPPDPASAAPMWAPASGWLLWELGAVVAATVLVTIIEAVLLGSDVVHALPMSDQLVVRGSVLLIYYGILFAFVWWLAARRHRPLAQAVGLRPADWRTSGPRVILYLIAVRAAGYVYAALLYFLQIHVPGQGSDLTKYFGGGLAGIAMTVVIAGLLGPLVEEVVFRGVVFGALSDLLPGWAAIVLSALIFAALHFNMYLFVPAFIVGVALALIYARSGSLWPAVVLHSLYNLTSIVLAYVYLFMR
jgi:membrane protease YdiL (CAAX protease family)